MRPELEVALALCRDIKSAAPGQTVIFTVHELKRPARNAAELMTLAAGLQAAGIQMELLSGPLTGIYDPNGLGAMLFAVLAVAAHLDRDYIRDKTLEGQQAAAARGNHGGRPKVIDDDMLTFALALRAKGVPIPAIAAKLKIATGKNAGKPPSVVSLYRALVEAEQADASQRAMDTRLPEHRRSVAWSSPASGSRLGTAGQGPSFGVQTSQRPFEVGWTSTLMGVSSENRSLRMPSICCKASSTGSGSGQVGRQISVASLAVSRMA